MRRDGVRCLTAMPQASTSTKTKIENHSVVVFQKGHNYNFVCKPFRNLLRLNNQTIKCGAQALPLAMWQTSERLGVPPSDHSVTAGGNQNEGNKRICKDK